jgi:hypothetical protein
LFPLFLLSGADPFFGVKSWFFTRNTPKIFTPPSAIGKNKIFWSKIVIFHTKYPKNFRASLRSAQFFLSAPPLTWNPGSAPDFDCDVVVEWYVEKHDMLSRDVHPFETIESQDIVVVTCFLLCH